MKRLFAVLSVGTAGCAWAATEAVVTIPTRGGTGREFARDIR